jgi:hypothetical protein
MLAPYQKHLQAVVSHAEQGHVGRHEGVELPHHDEDRSPDLG